MFPMQSDERHRRTFRESFVDVFVTHRQSLKILDNISVIISMKKYDTDTSLGFSCHTMRIFFVFHNSHCEIALRVVHNSRIPIRKSDYFNSFFGKYEDDITTSLPLKWS